MRSLFESVMIKGMLLSNRFVRSATWEGLAGKGGEVTPMLTKMMIELARGGVGLIITSHAYVRSDGQATPWQLGIHKDELVSSLRELTDAVHEAGGKIVMQLAHAGHFAAENLTGQTPLVVSNYKGLGWSQRRVASTADIREIVSAFADAAQRAKSAGFDGVQLHSAHGYLLSQFLSPLFNKREDEYGGVTANRARIHIEILDAIRDAVGTDYPVMIKMNCRDFRDGGLSLDDSMEAAGLLVDAGLDAIELSGGLLTNARKSPSRPGVNSEEKEAYHLEELKAFRNKIKIPLMLVGGIRSFGVAERLVEDGLADFISMSRPFIREPGLINRWKTGDRRRAECISDNLCFKPGFEGHGIYCVTSKEKEQNKPK